MIVRSLDSAAADDLRRVALSFGDDAAARKAAALARCASRRIDDPAGLVAYHDCLLCLLAYPETRALRDAARAELSRVAAAARDLIAKGRARIRARLANTGIAWTPVTINFGWDIARWLVERFPKHADIDSFGDDGVALSTVLAAALPPMEFELAAGDEASYEFLERASAGRPGTRLAWLVAALLRLRCDDALREQHFDALQPYTVIEPGRSMLSRTFVRGLPGPTYFHRDGLTRTVDVPALLDQPLAARAPLAHDERLRVVDAGRAMLAAMGRETDAIALASPDGVAWHELGRGVAVALYTMRPERRGPLDSHIGMMLFKNGIPVGYGGGWPFLGTCRIGVNIFAPYRGGESAFLFGQVLRVYRQRFAVRRFVVEPSQFGGTNKEGLQSGAFWFYYRLGFRPIEPRSARLAAEEWTRMQADPAYRTPIPALRRCGASDIELRLEASADCETASLSDAVTAWIAKRHTGDRSAAERAALAIATRALHVTGQDRWPESERRAFACLALLVAQIRDLDRWSAAEKRALIAVMRAKGGDEFRFHRLLGRHRRLRDALVRIANAAGTSPSPAVRDGIAVT
ncbi:MAG: hypothetical protein ABI724_13245 [Betaproteobacteria bacterium]